MDRSRLLPATITLATVTALTALAAAVTLPVPEPAPPDDAATSANRAAVWRFYDAVNAVIATGDPAPLADVLTSDYAEPDAAGVLLPGRDDLERHLRALHATVPGLRLHADEVVGDDDAVVVAFVRAHGVDRATAFGLPLANEHFWGPIDRFRVAGGRIAERASTGERPALLEPLVRAPVELPLPADRVVTAVRVAIEPGGWRRVPGVDGLQVLVVEAGELTVTIAAEGVPPVAPKAPDAALAAGDWLVLPDGQSNAGYTVRNPGPAPALLLDVVATVSGSLRGAGAPAADSATARVLAGGQWVTVATGPVALSVGRATLAPGARLAWTGPPGAVLLSVEAGSLDLVTKGETTWVRPAADGVAQAHGFATLGAGDGALIGSGMDGEVHNASDGAVTVLFVTLIGAPDEPRPPTT